jgi:uncharacterized membrane protein YphA (DoxX/SURF4 family)
MDALRIAVGALVVVPGVSKFLTYEQSVQFFAALQIPAAETLVVLVGAVEIVVAGSMFLDRGVLYAALSITPVMAVAIVTAGPTWQNIGVLLAATVLIGVNATS